jgi:hypothetical protein
MKTKSVAALGVAVTIIGASLEAGEQEWCKPACDWIADQPHVPHDSHTPTSVRSVFGWIASNDLSVSVEETVKLAEVIVAGRQ